MVNMAKTIVNKHFDDVKKIIREQFHDKEEYAKGEIIIVNDENPSLWVLDENCTPKQISGVNNGGGEGGSSIDESVINDIISGYTAADNNIIKSYKEADKELKSGYEDADTEIIKDYTNKINALDAAYKAKDVELSQGLIDVENSILAHTVNGIAISENPILTAENISIGGYSQLVLDGNIDYVTSLDNTQVAVKKIENMAIANALAFAAGLNDVNNKTRLRVNEIDDDGTLNYTIKNGYLNAVKINPSPVVETRNVAIIKFRIVEVDENHHINCEVIFNSGNATGFDIYVGDESVLSSIGNELLYIIGDRNLEENTMYSMVFKYNYVEIRKMSTL